MKLVGYLLAIVLGLPAQLFALGLLALDHAVAHTKPLNVFLGLLDAVAWGIPAILLATLVMVLMGFARISRVVGAALLLLLNVGVLVVSAVDLGAPGHISDLLYFLPTVVAGFLCGHQLATHFGWLPQRGMMEADPAEEPERG